MATAEQLRDELETFLDKNKIKFHRIDEADNQLALFFGEDSNDTYVLADFDENGDEADGIHFSSAAFAKSTVPLAKVYPVLNDLNRTNRWVKFFVDDDGYISAESDAMVFPGSVGEECSACILRMSRILDKAIDKLSSVSEISNEEKQAIQMAGLLFALR